MTDLQREQLRSIITQKQRMEQPEAILNLIIQFFQVANKCYKNGIKNVTGLEWEKEKEIFSSNVHWRVYLIDKMNYQKKEGTKGDLSVFLGSSEEKELFVLLQQLEEVNQEALAKVLQDESLEELGFSLCCEEDVKSISMP